MIQVLTGERRRRRVHAAGDPADRPPRRAARDAHRRPGHHLPRDRRPRPADPAQRDARRQRAEPGAVDRRGRLPAGRVGDRSVLADRRQPGRDPARLERGHPRVPLGREGDRAGDDLLGAGRLRGDRAAARDAASGCSRRRRQPRQPALRRGRRGDPDGQPDRRREARQPGLPRVLRQRLQRHPRARAVRLGGHPGVGRRTCASIRRDVRPRGHRGGIYPFLRAGDVRGRPRPDRLRRADRHDARPARRLRDVLELRRGRPPLGPRARRHAGGAAQARPAVRAHREGPPLRAAAVRDRRPLRPRPDPGRRPSSSATATGWTTWSSARCRPAR